MPSLFRLAVPALVAASLAAGAMAARASNGSVDPGATVRTGVVEGRVVVERRPPRRSAARYPGAGAGTNEVQMMAAVVYLEGIPATTPSRGEPPVAMMAQSDTAFEPAVLVVPPGTRVEFPNGDPFFHNVFSYSSGARFDLGRYPQGESKSVTLSEPGTVKIYCEVHDFMRAAVLVVDAAFRTVVDDEGRFSFSDVPAGRYTLVAWHVDLGRVEEEVVVTDGGRVDVSLTLGG